MHITNDFRITVRNFFPALSYWGNSYIYIYRSKAQTMIYLFITFSLSHILSIIHNTTSFAFSTYVWKSICMYDAFFYNFTVIMHKNDLSYYWYALKKKLQSIAKQCIGRFHGKLNNDLLFYSLSNKKVHLSP